ncbi:DUF485 domain-containing protein [Streptomyces sp. bgisy034]|uniref:DUF485 domain-containing protein n=1 Tax=Streptomyces sp. bgisy034 TaxID=3413774 RepID=UPI003EB98A13
MTHSDENRYPPPASPAWHRPHTDPQPYGYGAPHYDTPHYDAPRYDAPRYEPYGQAPWDEPYAQETPRHGADLAALRSAYRLLRRVSTLTALGSFVLYVVLSCGAPELMRSKIAGELSLGMTLGLLQLVVTFVAVFWYGRSAQHRVDPLARAVREQAVTAGRNTGVAR